jgi:hypothetical protein
MNSMQCCVTLLLNGWLYSSKPEQVCPEQATYICNAADVCELAIHLGRCCCRLVPLHGRGGLCKDSSSNKTRKLIDIMIGAGKAQGLACKGNKHRISYHTSA